MDKLYVLGVWGIIDACSENHVHIGEHIAEKYLDELRRGNTIMLPGGTKLVPEGKAHCKVVSQEG